MSDAAASGEVVAVVTGATGGMGQVIARALARSGATVITVARDPRRAEELRRQIDHESTGRRLEIIQGDLSLREDVCTAAQMITDRHKSVDLLLNNAGAHFPSRQLSADGIELHIAVDYLAGFGMTSMLAGALRRGRGRVVNVASDSLNDTRRIKLSPRPRPVTLDTSQLHDVHALNPAAGFAPFEAYARAKLLTVIAGYDFAQRLAGDGITVNSVHPGIVATGIVDDLTPSLLRPVRGLIRRSLRTPEQGAAAILRVAHDPTGVTGAYFDRDSPSATPAICHDHAARQELHASSARHFGLSQ